MYECAKETNIYYNLLSIYFQRHSNRDVHEKKCVMDVHIYKNNINKYIFVRARRSIHIIYYL